MKLTRLILWSVVLLLPALSSAQSERKINDEKRCVTCHVQWHEDHDQANNLLPNIRTSTVIDGRPGIVSDAEMCLSCHDGYVMDSRETFSSTNHQGDLDKAHIRIQGLPLNTTNAIYCGTCHTPHALKPVRRGSLAPFLREPVTNSTLCLDCHADHAQDQGSHPIHVIPDTAAKLSAETFLGTQGELECMTCHPIHGTEAVIGVSVQDRTVLCSSCHASKFQINSTDHDLSSTLSNKSGAIGPSLADQDACASCHVSHGGQGKFMWAGDLDRSQGENAYCLGCHSATGLGREKSFSHMGHPVSGKSIQQAVPELALKAGDQLQCVTCHDPHQWDPSGKHAVDSANEEGTEYTSFLRLPDDSQGQLCIACHAEQQAIVNSDHGVSRVGFQQYFSEIGTLHGQCSTCHDTHGPSGLRVTEPQADLSRSLCESCHTGTHAPTTIGGWDHPLGGQLPAGVDLPNFQGGLTCITCHDPHNWGTLRESSPTADLQGNDANSFLRITNWPQPELCLNCHPEQATVINTKHAIEDPDHNTCSQCHSPHNARHASGILAAWDDQAGETFSEKICLSCHQQGAVAEGKIPPAWSHPHQYGTVPPNVRGSGTWEDFPLFDANGPNRSFGYVDCLTCHDPHTWSFKSELATPESVKVAGDHLSSFLRNPARKTLCTDCHGINALWKYNYFHDPERRLRY